MSSPPSRRDFLQTVVYSGLTGYLAITAGACRRGPSLKPKSDSGLAFFTPDEYATTAAACECILPRDEDPGAIDLDVPKYVDRALAVDDYLHWADRFREGIHELEAEAKSRHGKSFHLAAADDQNDLIEDLESGTAKQHEFFKMLMHLTLEGAFGDPSHGGNKGGLGWRLIGFAPGEPMPGMHHSHG